jgi:uncharacterized membrane protein
MLKLIGIAVVAVGFALRINTLLVVLAAGVATGLVAGVPFNVIIEKFGAMFVENRYITMPVVLIVPLIGMLEHHGLQQRAEVLIRRVKAATAGRVLLAYCAIRQLTVSVGIRIGEHASMVRPLIAPMAEAAARTAASPAELSPEAIAAIRAHAAAAENVGNFFGEDIFVAVGAVLLMNGFFQGVHLEVSMWTMALWGIPTAIVAFLLMWWRMRALDRRVETLQTAFAADVRGSELRDSTNQRSR